MSLLQCTLPLNKHSPDRSLDVFLNKRDYIVDPSGIEPVHGVVLLHNLRNFTDPETKLFARVQCELRYGSEDMDGVISGVSFKKSFQLCSAQIYPKTTEIDCSELQALQELIVKMKKSSPKAILLPFRLEMGEDQPLSISLQQSAEENPNNEALGIEYMVQIVSGDASTAALIRESSIQVVIRRLSLWNANVSVASYTREVNKKFHLHAGGINVEATLPKEVFYHNESVPMFLVVENNSSNIVTKIIVKVEQVVEFTLFHVQTVSHTIVREVIENKMPIHPGQGGWFHSYRLRPTLNDNRHIVGLALDGKLKHEDTTLASTTYIKDKARRSQMGIIVQYLIRVKIVTGCGGRDIDLEVPFILSHLRPGEEMGKTQANAVLLNKDIFYLGEMLSASMKSRQGLGTGSSS